jgi:hypothetical protein
MKEITKYVFNKLNTDPYYFNGLIYNINSNNNLKWENDYNIDPYGKVDIIGFSDFFNTILHIYIINVKDNSIEINDIENILENETGIKRIFDINHPHYKAVKIYTTLIAPSIGSGFNILNNLKNLNVLVYQNNSNNYNFKSHNSKYLKRNEEKLYNKDILNKFTEDIKYSSNEMYKDYIKSITRN